MSAKILLESGVNEADLLIAVTSSDEMNMVCCVTAKKLGVAHTIARIRDQEYANELSMLKEELGLDMVINPEQAIGASVLCTATSVVFKILALPLSTSTSYSLLLILTV